MAFLNPPPGIDDYRFAIVELLDARARERRDGNAVSIATYVGSTNPQWVAVAAAYVPWRDAVWAYAYAELDKVMVGERAVPAVKSFIAELPEVKWPA